MNLHMSLAWLALSFALFGAGASAQFTEADAHLLFERSGIPATRFGAGVAALGDVNGDGVLDVAASAPRADGPATLSGTVFALSGVDGSTLWSRSETSFQAFLGLGLETMDWDDDGVLDVVAGAAGAGRVQIFSGTDGTTLATLVGPASASASFGAYLAVGGDLDGDGTQDLLVSAPGLAAGSELLAGRIYAYARGSTLPFATLDGGELDFLGTGLTFLGDIDAPPDGRAEFVAGRRFGGGFTGEARVYGWNGTSIDLRFPTPPLGFGAGCRLHGGKDLDGDGIPDFAAGDVAGNQVRLLSGANGEVLRTLDGEGEGGGFGFVRLIGDVEGDIEGDIEGGDGGADVAVGAWENSSGAPNGGKVFVYSGASGALLKTITSLTPGQRLGYDVRELGDLNGDGKLDLVVGALGGIDADPAGSVLAFSAHLSAPANTSYPAALATDPDLFDSGGDPTSGPIVGSPIEVFNTTLDCTGAPSAGLYGMAGTLALRAHPFPTSFGGLWLAGPLLFQCGGAHTQNLVECHPGGLVLPPNPALIGISYTVQGLCAGRLSVALRQTIGG